MLVAFLLSVNPASASVISGHVYLEEGNGVNTVKDADEDWGIGGIQMRLTGGGSNLSYTTNEYGYYEFTADAGSGYTITQVGLHTPDYYLVHPSTSGGSGTVPTDYSPPRIENITLSADVSGYNFGNFWWTLSTGQAISPSNPPPYAAVDPNVIPEPGSLLMLLSGSAFVAFALRRRRRK
jgi:hypothetical protein